MQIDLIEDRFARYKKALRKSDRKIFDRLMRTARMEIQAGVMASAPDPFQVVLLSILIRQQGELDECRRKLRIPIPDETLPGNPV